MEWECVYGCEWMWVSGGVWVGMSVGVSGCEYGWGWVYRGVGESG